MNTRAESITVRPVTSAGGAEVHGIELADATDEQFEQIRQALFAHGAIFARDQSMSHAGQEEFTARFGD